MVNLSKFFYTLMSPTDNGPPRYIWVPLVLKNQKKYSNGHATIFHLLKRHHQFIEEFKSFQIKGVHWMTIGILKPMIMTDCPAINAIEPTFRTDNFGKWTICSTKEKLSEAQEWTPDDIPSLPKAVARQQIIVYNEVSGWPSICSV
jgi:hypothetical protein